MKDKTFIRFLQEIIGEDKLEVRFPITEYMEWAGIPFQQLEKVEEDVANDLHVLMNYLATFTLYGSIATLTKYTRIISSFTVVGTVIKVDFCEWTVEEREQEDWLVKFVEKMEKKNEFRKEIASNKKRRKVESIGVC